MCKGMNRSFFNVIPEGGATDQASSAQSKEQKPTKVEMQMMQLF